MSSIDKEVIYPSSCCPSHFSYSSFVLVIFGGERYLCFCADVHIDVSPSHVFFFFRLPSSSYFTGLHCV